MNEKLKTKIWTWIFYAFGILVGYSVGTGRGANFEFFFVFCALFFALVVIRDLSIDWKE